jgi:drug/metabolite transporter (DMT)-like permease
MSQAKPVVLGLFAAIAWGSADFAGGFASKRANVYHVVIGSEAIGIFLLIPTAILRKEPVPPLTVWLIAGLGGMAGGFGLILLYRALANGQMSIAAPVSALGGALTPVLAGFLLEGIPHIGVLKGIVLALLAIFLVSHSEGDGKSSRFRLDQLILPGIAGVLFGLFFILLHQSSQEAVLWPIVAVRISSVLLLILIAGITHQTKQVDRIVWPWILGSGLLDTTGNILYVIAGQLGRMDVAAVLSSLYPAMTVALAYLILKERISMVQWVGVVLALIAIVFIML